MAGHQGGSRGVAYRPAVSHRKQRQQAKPSFSGSGSEAKGEDDYERDLEAALQASVADARQNSSAAGAGAGAGAASNESTNQDGDASLPYGGDLQAANRAQDRDAIRTIMKHQQEQRCRLDVAL